jgi:hypothetical protein
VSGRGRGGGTGHGGTHELDGTARGCSSSGFAFAFPFALATAPGLERLICPPNWMGSPDFHSTSFLPRSCLPSVFLSAGGAVVGAKTMGMPGLKAALEVEVEVEVG